MSEIPSHLKWACRRGMLELDVLLGNFLESAYPKLSAAEKQQFEKLLKCEDQELFEWLIHGSQSDPDLSTMVEKIRENARNKRSS